MSVVDHTGASPERDNIVDSGIGAALKCSEVWHHSDPLAPDKHAADRIGRADGVRESAEQRSVCANYDLPRLIYPSTDTDWTSKGAEVCNFAVRPKKCMANFVAG